MDASSGAFARKADLFFGRLSDKYEILLDKILRFKKSFLALSFTIFALCMAFAGKVGMDFMPLEDNAEFEIFIKAKPGISALAMSEKSREVLDVVNKDDRVEFAYLTVGYTDSKEAFKSKIYVK